MSVDLSGPNPAPIQLTNLEAGDSASYHASELEREDRDLLRAVGMTERCQLRVCKSGDPWIVQVRTTRIGLSSRLASKILVVPATAR